MSKQFVIVKDHSKGNAWSEHWVILDHGTEAYYLSDPDNKTSYVHDKDWNVTYAKSTALNVEAKAKAQAAKEAAQAELAKAQTQASEAQTTDQPAEAPKPQPKRRVAVKPAA